MSARTCAGPDCDKPSGDGIVCRACLRQLERVLAEIPWLLRELDIAEAKEARFSPSGDKVTTIGGNLPMPLDLSAVDARKGLHDALAVWVRRMEEPEPARVQAKFAKARQAKAKAIVALAAHTPTNASAWLLRHAERVRVYEDAGDLMDEILGARATAKYVIDRPAERRYLGECGATVLLDDDGPRVTVELDADGARCTETLWGRQGETFAHCRTCGAEWLMEPRLERIQDEAMTGMNDRIMTATQAAETLVAFGVAANTTAVRLRDQVTKWAERGQLVKRIDLPLPGERSRPGYRLGDVIALVLEAAERKDAGRKTRRSA